MEKLKELLTSHDWYFNSAGDHKSWLAGSREKDEIIKEAKAQGLSHQDMVSTVEGMGVTREVVKEWCKIDWEKA